MKNKEVTATWKDPKGKVWIVRFLITPTWTFQVILEKARMEFAHLFKKEVGEHDAISIEIKPLEDK